MLDKNSLVIVLISKGNVQSGSEMLNVYAFLLFCYFGLVLIIGLAAFIMPNLFYKAAKRIIKTRTKELEDLRCIIEDEEKESEEKPVNPYDVTVTVNTDDILDDMEDLKAPKIDIQNFE